MNIEEIIKKYYDLMLNGFANTKRTKYIKSVLCKEMIAEYKELLEEQGKQKSDEIFENKYNLMNKIKGKSSGIGGLRIELDESRHNAAEDMTVIFDSQYDFLQNINDDKVKACFDNIKEITGIDFCFKPSSGDWWFDCNKKFVIVGTDVKGGCIGGIGGYCCLEEDIAVGYISQEGYYGQVANNLKEFLELILFYPFWSNVIELRRCGKSYDLRSLEKEWVEKVTDYYEKQKQVANYIKLCKNADSIRRLFENLQKSKDFEVWSCDDNNLELENIGGI